MTKLHYWGERGLVTALVHDIDEDGIGGWRQFLELLQPKSPILPAANTLTDVWAVIEPSFGSRGFGHPDLIIRLTYQNEDAPIVLFVEAKLAAYARAAHRDRNADGFNSAINGQIELNHRLALALSDFTDGDSALVEPLWILDCEEYESLGPDTPRKVEDNRVLQTLASALGGLSIERYGHVILTSDSDDPIDEMPPDLRPRIMASAISEMAWGQIRRRLLWCGWQSLYSRPEWTRYRETHDVLQVQPDHRSHPVSRQRMRGVSLIHIRGMEGYIYLSWLGGSYRLRDYGGTQRIDLAHDRPLGELLDDLVGPEIEIPQPERRRYEDFDYWHQRTVEANDRLRNSVGDAGT